MKVFRGVPDIKGPSILMLGIFDGIHVAHQQIIANAMKQSKTDNIPVILYSFLYRPNEVLRGQKANMLTSEAQKLAILSKLGIDAICIDKFDDQFAKTSAEEWLDNICMKLKPVHIFIGFNYHFGHLGQGDKQMLIANEQKYGYKVHIMEKLQENDRGISSTVIRNYILDGNIESANSLLGRKFTLPLELINDDIDKYVFIKPERMILPGVGKYQATVEYFLDKKKVSCDSVLNIENTIFILKDDLPNSQTLPKKIAVSLLHRIN
ncbi:MAG: FAD synthetase family protein [Eubacteriales bacterium]|nr:FAD synthetase family protein [Eubacteriales bacterium]